MEPVQRSLRVAVVLMRGCSPERVEARGKTERLVVQRAGPTRLCLGKSFLCALLVKFSNTRRSQNSQGDGGRL